MKKEKVIFLIGVVLLGILIIWAFIEHKKPTLILKNKKEITIALNTPYEEYGAKSFWFFHSLNHQIKINGEVDVTKVGEYKVSYEVTYQKKTTKKTRIVHVKDLTPPKITLLGESKSTVCPNQEYQEEGYQAIDEYDGDLTDQVKVTREKDQLIYEVKDRSGNKETVVRKLVYEDKTAPVITLSGEHEVIFLIGETYQEPGYQALDSCDGDITKQVETISNVNTKIAGNYTITYQVRDHAGNEAKVERTIIVVPYAPNKANMIYLTFDDGPSSLTSAILDVLKEEGVKATFFVIGGGNAYDNVIIRANQEGHTIGLHSASHNYGKIYASEDAYFADLELVQNRVARLIGKKPTLIRFPGGSSNTISKFNPGIMSRLTKQVRQKGFQYFDWNVSAGDAANATTSSKVYQNVISGLSKNRSNVVLMHDAASKKVTLNALRDIIRYGKLNGYEFAAMTPNSYPAHHGVAN